MTTNNGQPKPFPYQKEGIKFIEKCDGRCLVADQMGTGKSLQTLWALEDNPQWLPALIITPASVKYQWEYEAHRNTTLKASVCEGQTPPKFSRYSFFLQTDLTIINYDILRFWVEYLKKVGFEIVVFDEIQFLSNRKNKRSKAARSLARKIKRRIGLSGTPLLNRPDELWHPLHLIWPKQYNSFWSYAQNWCNPRLTPWGWDTSGAENLDILHKELKQQGMIRRRKEDVLKDLPQKIRRVMPVELRNRQEYDEASTDFMNWLKKNKGHKVRSASKAVALTKINYLLQLIAKHKMKSVVEWANRFLQETDEKLGLFCTHTKAIDVLQRRVEEKSVTIDGSVRGKHRRTAIEQFANDPKTRLCIGNIKAAGVGTDGLQKSCSTMAVVELPQRPGDCTQLEDRFCRMGQSKSVWAYYMIAGNTIEEDLCKLLQRKQKTIDSVLDGEAESESFDLHTELLRKLENKL